MAMQARRELDGLETARPGVAGGARLLRCGGELQAWNVELWTVRARHGMELMEWQDRCGTDGQKRNEMARI